MSVILHIDFNSYFASVEQQANPHLRGLPIGISGGDRDIRTVLVTASKEAKARGVKTAMPIWQAKLVCPEIRIIASDSDKYLSITKQFISVLQKYGSKLEIFSIDEAFLELNPASGWSEAVEIAIKIKSELRSILGEYITCSVGISYNKIMAKLAGSLYKPDGLVVIEDPQSASRILDQLELDAICGIGYRIKSRLCKMGINNFAYLRAVKLELLQASFGKVTGLTLYNWSRGLDFTEVVHFTDKPQVKSISHRKTLDYDSADPLELGQILAKMTELIGRKLRHKQLMATQLVLFCRQSISYPISDGYPRFNSFGSQLKMAPTDDGLKLQNYAIKIFQTHWSGEKIRLIGVGVSGLKAKSTQTIGLFDDFAKNQTILRSCDQINDKYGEFTLMRASLINSAQIRRIPNPFLSDYRFVNKVDQGV